MIFFIKEYFFVLLTIILYGLVGGFALTPFRKHIRYPALAAPFSGMLLWPFGIFILYTFLGFSVKNAAVCLFLTGSSLTLGYLIYFKPRLYSLSGIQLSIFILLFAATVIILGNITSIMLGNAGFLFMEGSDHLGYAIMADWFNSHFIHTLPESTPTLPYESFPSLLMGHDHETFTNDNRFSSFFNLSIISFLFHRSATFSYDIACSILLLISYFGIAALYSRRNIMFILLSLALLTNHWFLLSKTGYLGKILGFPTVFFILGLYFIMQKDPLFFKKNRLGILTLLILNAAAAMVYVGQVLAMFLGIVIGIFLVFKFLKLIKHFDYEQFIDLKENALLLCIMIISALAIASFLSLPRYFNYSHVPMPLDWLSILLHQLDVRYYVHDHFVRWYTDTWAIGFLCIAIVIPIFAFVFATRYYYPIAMAYISASLLLLIYTYFTQSKWFAYELSGTLYTLTLCGIYLLLDLKTSTFTKNMVVILLFSAIIIRVPAFIENLHRYVGSGIPDVMQYSEKDMKHLTKYLNNQSVIIDVPYVMFSLPLLTDLMPRNSHLQWTPSAWKSILGYRTWAPPTIKPAFFILELNQKAANYLGLTKRKLPFCRSVLETRQYELSKCSIAISS